MKNRIEGIIRIVQDYYGGVDVFSKSQKREIVFARQVTMYMLFKIANLGVCAVGKMFSKNHSTVSVSRRVVADLCAYDPEVRKQIIDIETMLE
jgi:chromosomal replication initiator protein